MILSSNKKDAEKPEGTEEEEEKKVEEEEDEVQEQPTSNRPDPFAALDLPPPVGADDELKEDWEGEDFESVPSEVDHSALSAAQGAQGAQGPVQTISDADLFGSMGAHGGDPDLDAFNDPSIDHLGDPPMIGGRGGSTNLFGQTAQTPMGRATSPRLYAQASQFPTCTQLRCWKWENGIPVGLGVIDAMATEEDMVQQFFDAMPRKGDGKAQFKMRPIDINGQEMGQEVNVIISEHHAALKQLRIAKEEDEDNSLGGWGPGQGEDPTMASEMTRMFDNMMHTNDRRTRVLETTLESERDRLRRLDEERAQERVDMAMNAAQGVQALTERMMRDEASRSDRALKLQNEQSNTLINTLSSVFGQQQNMMASYSQQQQQFESQRLAREQQRADRERTEMEARRRRDQLEYEEKRKREQVEMTQKQREMEDQRRWEREQADEKRRTEDRKWERQMEEMRLRMERDRGDMERQAAQQRTETLARMKAEQLELERKMSYERERLEREEKRRSEERERQAQRDREHSQTMLKMTMLEKEEQRGAQERRERLEREMREGGDRQRQREHDMRMKEMELSKERDREHAERMMTLSKQELQNSGLGGLTEFLPKAGGWLKELGMEPADLVGRLLGGGGDSGGSGWMENLPKLLGAASDIVKAGMTGGMPQMPGMPVPQLPPEGMGMEGMGAPQMPDPRMIAEMRAQQAQRQQAEEQMRREQIRQMRAMRQAEAQREMERQQAQSQAASDRQASDPAANTQTVVEAGVSLKDQRSARKALRTLSKKVSKSEEEEWEGLITAAILEEVAIFHYIKAVTVQAALQETGLDEDTIKRLIGKMKESSLVPDDLPYGGE